MHLYPCHKKFSHNVVNCHEVAEITRSVHLGLLATNGGGGSRPNRLAIAFIPLL